MLIFLTWIALIFGCFYTLEALDRWIIDNRNK